MTKLIVKRSLQTVTLLIFLLTMYVLIFGAISIRNNELLNIFGYSYGLVPSDSMDGIAPEGSDINSFKRGSVIIVKFTDFDDLKINDVVVFKSEEEGIPLKVHRIVEEHDSYYVTKGDNPSSSLDIDDLVTKDKYQAKVTNVFYLFGIASMFTNFRGIILLVIIIVLIVSMLNQIYNLVKNHNDKKTNEISEEELEELIEARLNEIKRNEDNEK